MTNKTILLIGDSPFLENLENNIYYLIEKYTSMGINNAIRRYPIDIHVFQDAQFVPLTNEYPDVKTVSLYMYGDAVQKDNKELYDSYSYKFKENSSKDIFLNNKLAWCGFTHDYAISYCIMKGFDRIILLGTADFTGTKHYLTEEEFHYSEKLKHNSKKFIEEVASQRAQIVTANPKSYLNIPRINIEDLLNLTSSSKNVKIK